jgi:hypothetical protein
MFRVLCALTITFTMAMGFSYAQTILPVQTQSACCTGECTQSPKSHGTAKQEQRSTCSACCVGASVFFLFLESEKIPKFPVNEMRWELAQMYAPTRVEKPLLPPPRA